ncbi:MAG: hypothetical protein ABIT09_08400 [Croceibacterium sp.]
MAGTEAIEFQRAEVRIRATAKVASRPVAFAGIGKPQTDKGIPVGSNEREEQVAKDMPMRWSYLGKLGPEGRLDWGGDWSGNVPASGHILPDNNDLLVYLKIREHARKGEYGGAMVDWGAFAIRVNGPELLTILADCYGDLSRVTTNSLAGRYVSYGQSLGTLNYVAFISAEL